MKTVHATISASSIVITCLGATSPAAMIVQGTYSPAQFANEAHFGQCVADIGDIDGDGKHDLAVGAPGNEIYARTPGSVFLYSGATGALLRTLTGKANGDCFGVSIAALGDIDGDGCPDFVASASSLAKHGKAWDSGDWPAFNGYAQVHSGRTGTLLFTLQAPDKPARPTLGIQMFGWRVANAGDLDADGRADIAVSAPSEVSRHVCLFSTGTRQVIRTLSGRSTFGYALACAGDLNGDRIADLIIATPFGVPGEPNHSRGYVEVFSGADGSVLRTIHGSNTREDFGRAVQGGIDVDHDGVPDIIVGAVHQAIGDAIRFFSGASGAPLTFPASDGSDARSPAITFDTGTQLVNSFGTAFCVLDDLDGDGAAELLAGDGIRESANIFRLRPPFRRLDVISAPQSAACLFGSTLCALNDVNGDGVSDFAIGCPWGNEVANESRNGGAWIYSGLDRTILHAFSQP